MKQKTLSFLFIILSIPPLAPCQGELSAVGGKWMESFPRTIQTDICTVHISTILGDFLATSGNTICQIGTIGGLVWDRIKTASYVEYDAPGVSFSENANHGFGSIIIQFCSSGNYLGDILNPQRISLRSFSENLPLDKGYLYSKSTAAYRATPLVSSILTPALGKTIREYEIRLSNEWELEWFEHFQNGSREMELQEYFHDYFRSIAFILKEGGSYINGFMMNDLSLCTTFYYHQTKTDAMELPAGFPASSDLRFNQISCDRSQTALPSLQSGINNGLPSEEFDYQAYLQELTGMYLNVDFPFLDGLRVEGRSVTIENVLLRLYPVKETYGERYPLPESLILYIVDENNVMRNVMTDISGSSMQAGSPVTDEIIGEEAYYSLDIISFLQSNLGTMGYNRKTLQLMLSDNLFFTTLSGIVFRNVGHPGSSPMRLAILCKTYDP